MHACMYVCMYDLCMYACMHVRKYVSMCVCIQVCMISVSTAYEMYEWLQYSGRQHSGHHMCSEAVAVVLKGVCNGDIAKFNVIHCAVD